jgi:redox-regulated HSP33 family molecular chaperone
VGVVLDAVTGEVTAACGYLCAALPGCSDAELARLEANVLALPPPSELATLLPGTVARRLLMGVTKDSTAQRFSSDNESRWTEHVELRCGCGAPGASARALLAALKHGGTTDDKDKDQDEGWRGRDAGTVVTCEWCGKGSTVSQTDIDGAIHDGEVHL